MIPGTILNELVPEHFPEDASERTADLRSVDGPAARIGAWADVLRRRLSEQMRDDLRLRTAIDASGFVGTGIFRVPTVERARASDGFPIVLGFQFGTVLLRGDRLAAKSLSYEAGVGLDGGRYKAPVVEFEARQIPHGYRAPDGCVAAVFDDEGTTCGLTAGHVVSRARRGQRVAVECSDCRAESRLRSGPAGLLDVACVEFPCGGPFHEDLPSSSVRSAIEGETVSMEFGMTGRVPSTVMQSLSTPSQILSVAAPQHFLTDRSGNPGDSGSLVASCSASPGTPELIGMYLGETDCRDENGHSVCYGYGLDLGQAARMVGASQLKGEFVV